MKRFLILAGLLGLSACTRQNSQIDWSTKSLAEAQRLAGDKLIMVGFFTEW